MFRTHNAELGPALELVGAMVEVNEAVINLRSATLIAESAGLKPKDGPVPERIKVSRRTSAEEMEDMLTEAQVQGELKKTVRVTGEVARETLLDLFRAGGAAKAVIGETFGISRYTFQTFFGKTGLASRSKEIWGHLPQILGNQAGEDARLVIELASQIRASLAKAQAAESRSRQHKA